MTNLVDRLKLRSSESKIKQAGYIIDSDQFQPEASRGIWTSWDSYSHKYLIGAILPESRDDRLILIYPDPNTCCDYSWWKAVISFRDFLDSEKIPYIETPPNEVVIRYLRKKVELIKRTKRRKGK